MSEEENTDSKTCEVLDPSVNDIAIAVCNNNSDANSSTASENAKISVAQETDLLHQALPITVAEINASDKPLTADFEYVESNNAAENIYTKDLSVSDSSILDPAFSLSVDNISSILQSHNLPQCVNDSNSSSLQQDGCGELLSVSLSSSEQCNGGIGQLPASESAACDISGGCETSGDMIQSTDHHHVTSESDKADAPSTIVSAENAADMKTCCNDEDDDTLYGTEATGDSQGYKHNGNANGLGAGSLNEIARIADHSYTNNQLKTKKKKRRITANGRLSCGDCYFFPCLIYL